MKILFVCTGNTCRSPMAQALAQSLFGKEFKISSAGVMAMAGGKASTHALSAMKERKLSLKAHRSRPVTEVLLQGVDLVLAMTPQHKAALVSVHHNVYTLGEYAGCGSAVPDPYGGDLAIYRACAENIYQLLVKIKERILMNNLHVTGHPLVENKLTRLRNVETGNKEFRELVREIATFICYEATRDVSLTEVEIETPVCKTKAHITDQKFGIVPILRAGLGMVEGISSLLPTAKIGHIGMYRNPESAELKPVEYYCKLPEDSANREILLLDPMIGTGSTAELALTYLKEQGVRQIKFLSILASPEGVQRLYKAHPDVMIYTAALDERLNDHKYIVPGLGDAGDRLFGTK